MSKHEKYFFYTKLVIINVLIFVFGFGLYHLAVQAINNNNDTMLGIIAGTLGTPTIGLISLEINLIFKHLRKGNNNVKQD